MIFNRDTIPNAIRAALRAGIFAAKGKKLLVDSVTENTRLKICASCLSLEISSMQCKTCTCFVRSKVNLASESCPEKKW